MDIDLEKFFDRVNHDKLMGNMAKRLEDKRLLRIIRAFLNAGVMENGLVSATTEGAPQGGPLGSTGGSGISTVQEYDPATNTWTGKADMPTARCLHSISVENRKIYAIGGSVLCWPWTGSSMVEVYTVPPLTVGEPEVLVQGPQLHAASGIYFDSHDQLCIACGLGPEIVGMDIETGEIIDRITTEVHSPDDLTFGPDGSLYWTDILTVEVPS